MIKHSNNSQLFSTFARFFYDEKNCQYSGYIVCGQMLFKSCFAAYFRYGHRNLHYSDGSFVYPYRF